MSNVIARHGCPQTLLTDNGSNFTSKVVSQINSSLCINHNFSAPYHPETNGSIERVNGTLKSILRRLVEQNSCSWEPYVPLSLLAYRSTVHSSTLKSPFEVIYGRKVVLPGTLELSLPLASSNPDSYMRSLNTRLITLHKEAYRQSAYDKLQRHLSSSSRSLLHPFDIGEKVLLLRTRAHLPLHKLNFAFTGPYTITQKFGLNVYSLKDNNGRVLQRVHGKFIRKLPNEETMKEL